MKKIGIMFLLMLSVALSAAGLFGCGNNAGTRDRLVGRWEVTQIRISTSFGFNSEVIESGHPAWYSLQGHITFFADGTYDETLAFARESGTWDISRRNLNTNVTASSDFHLRNDTYRFDVRGDTFTRTERVSARERITVYYSRVLPLSAPANLRIAQFPHQWGGWDRAESGLTWDAVERTDHYVVEYRRAGETEFETVFFTTSENYIRIENTPGFRFDNIFSLRPGLNEFRVTARFFPPETSLAWLDSEPSYYELYLQHDRRLNAPSNIVTQGSFHRITWDNVAGAAGYDLYIKHPDSDFVLLYQGGPTYLGPNSRYIQWHSLPAGSYTIRIKAVGAGLMENGMFVIPVSPYAYFNFVRDYRRHPVPNVTVTDSDISWNNIMLTSVSAQIKRAGDDNFSTIGFREPERVVFQQIFLLPGINIVRFRREVFYMFTIDFEDGVIYINRPSDFVYVYLEVDQYRQLVNYDIIIRSE